MGVLPWESLWTFAKAQASRNEVYEAQLNGANMSEIKEPNDRRDQRVPYEENVPSSRILKLALLAAAIIVIIGIVLYLKARHEPPALKDQLNTTSAQFYARNVTLRRRARMRRRFQEARTRTRP